MLTYVYNNNAGTNLEIFVEVESAHFYFVDEFDGQVKRSFSCSPANVNKYICELTDFVKVYEA